MIFTYGPGLGLGGGVSAKTGFSSAPIPLDANDFRVNAAGALFFEGGASGKLDPNTGEFSPEVSVLNIHGGASRNDTWAGANAGLRAEASVTYNESVTLAQWKPGALDDWFYDRFTRRVLTPGHDRELRRLKTEIAIINIEKNFQAMGWYLDANGVWQPPISDSFGSPPGSPK